MKRNPFLTVTLLYCKEMTGGCETLLPVYFENLSNVKVYIHRACYRYVKHKEHEKVDARIVSWHRQTSVWVDLKFE